MKFKTIFLMAIMLIMVLSVVSAVPGYFITGTVIDEETKDPIWQADVTVTCEREDRLVQTHKDGTFSARFSPTQCSGNGLVMVVASKEGYLPSTKVGDVHAVYDIELEKIDLNVPEFSIATGIISLGAAFAGLRLIRKKK